ncbi:hypothetical protein PCE1_002242 [Barthelona sp. PCE]
MSTASKDFFIREFGDKVLVSSSEGALNLKHFCEVIKDERFHIAGPSIVDDSTGKWSMLKPTLLECSVFYRSLHAGDFIKIELFQFCEGAFGSIKSYEIPFQCPLTELFLLNREFIVCNRMVDGRRNITFLNLSDQRFVDYYTDSQDSIHYVVQDDVVYILEKHYDVSVIKMVSFSDGNMPSLIENHPLKDIKVHAVDCTPSNNRFVIAQDDGYFSCTVDSEFLTNNRLLYELPYNFHDSLEYAHIANAIVPHPCLLRNEFHDVFSDSWNYVLLDGVVHCTEYSSEDGQSHFYQMMRKEGVYQFVLGTAKLSFQPSYSDEFKEMPMIFDYLNRSVTLFNPSTDYFTQCLISVCGFFDTQWRIGHATEEECTIRLYIDGVESKSFDLPQEVPDDYSIVFNECHHLVYYGNFDYNIVINGAKYNKEFSGKPLLAGNNIWAPINENKLTMLILNESGRISKTVKQSFDVTISKLIQNHYCHDECIVMSREGSFFVRHDGRRSFLVEEVQFARNCDPCFIREGVFVCGGKIFDFDSDVSSFLLNHEMRRMYSPAPNVAISYRILQDFLQFEMKVLTTENSRDGVVSYSVEKIVVESYDFISQCSISSVVSSFGCYK